MSDTLALLLVIIATFTLSITFAPIVIHLMKKVKASQTVLQYVEKHKLKSGTPTMGGLIFIFPAIIVTLLFAKINTTFALVSSLTMLSYGVLGFLDDFIKVKFKQNLGLKAYQKIIGQIGIAVIVTLYCYYNDFIGTSIRIPFTDIVCDLGGFFIPFCMITFIACTNAVNLTDGLDGLAGKTGIAYLSSFLVILIILMIESSYAGDTRYANELFSLACFSAAMIGGLFSFVWCNSFPAKIFMGDTGSMALGGACACVAIFSRNPLIVFMVGIMYIVSCITVIIQVVYFKLTKGKRVFLMAPYHHHLENKGIHESKIVSCYTIITILMGIISVISVLV